MLQRFITILLIFILGFQSYNVKSEQAFYSSASFFAQDTNTYFLHTVESGQTVFSISKMYNVSVDEIYRLNPGSVERISIGGQLKIPQESGSYFYHTIQPRETLYSVSRQYYMKGEDITSVNPGLTAETFTIGKVIRIPTNRVTTPMEGNEVYNQTLTNALLNPAVRGENIQTINVALLLPFGLQEGTNAKNAANNKMVEYYEGFLLALEELKQKGISVNLQVHDIGSGITNLPEILKIPTMQEVNLIIGGFSDSQIKLIANFAQEKNIPYVSPFVRSDEFLNNHQVYQINTPPSYLYARASAAFCNKYKNANIIFYIPNQTGNRMDFIQTLQQDLRAKGILYNVITTGTLSTEIQKAINDNNDNIFIPNDDGKEILLRLITHLKPIAEARPQLSLALFGYPTWQVYSAAEYSDDFFRLNASFYSFFYANPTDLRVRGFYNNYYRWFSRELIGDFPKYGILGYDVGMYFIQLLQKYGTAYVANINSLNYRGIQTDFHFEKVNNWGGFINTNIYLVEFNPDFTITSSRIK
jgi:LysM repeat protein